MKRFFRAFLLTALFFWLSFFFVLFFQAPKSWVNFLFFFLSLLGGLTFSLALVLFYLFSFFNPSASPRKTLREGLRRGFWLAFCLVFILLLKLLKLVSLFNVGLVLGIIILLEIYFSQK